MRQADQDLRDSGLKSLLQEWPGPEDSKWQTDDTFQDVLMLLVPCS